MSTRGGGTGFGGGTGVLTSPPQVVRSPLAGCAHHSARRALHFYRGRARMAHKRQSKLDSSLGLQANVLQTGHATYRCQENMAQIRQSRPDSGLDSQIKVH